MIVVSLGHRLKSETIHPHLKRRVDASIDAFRRTDARHLFFSGGRANPAIPKTECEVMRAYAVERGGDQTRLHLDEQALDTIGNGFFTRRMVDELDEEIATVHVVTADYHAKRAKFVFEQCYGDRYEITVDHCIETDVPSNQTREQQRVRQVREFFNGITPGDAAAIRRRMHEAHDLYSFPALTTTPS